MKWSIVRPLLLPLEPRSAETAAAVMANGDQLRAFLLDHYRELGLDLRDPDVVGAAVAVLAAASAAAGSGARQGLITAEQGQAVVDVCRVIGAALGSILPPELLA